MRCSKQRIIEVHTKSIPKPSVSTTRTLSCTAIALRAPWHFRGVWMRLKTPTQYVAGCMAAAVARILTVDVAGHPARSYLCQGMGTARCSPNGKCHRSHSLHSILG